MNKILECRFDSRKSFYGKAIVSETGSKQELLSYNILVASIEGKKAKVFNVESQTTLRHVKEFLKQNGFVAETKNQIIKDYFI